jgi:plastocyanin
MAYARGKNSKAISDRSGMAFPYSEMVREWNGSFVHKSEFEPKHPQIRRKHITADAVALANARSQKFQQPIQPFINDSTADQTKTDSGGGGQAVVNLTLPGDFAFRTEGSISQTSTDADPQYGSMVPDDGSAENRKRELTAEIGNVTIDATAVTILAITVVSTDDGNRYFIDGVRQATPNFVRGNTYRFNQADSSNSGHPLRISETSDGTHNSGTEYTTGVTTTSEYTQITVASDAPSTLYYYCSNHSGMGGSINVSG